jgi:hypothetical protein
MKRAYRFIGGVWAVRALKWGPELNTDVNDETEWFDPLEEVEQYLAQEQLQFERAGEFEIQFSVTGTWCDYPMWFRWIPEANLLQVGLGIEARIPENRRTEVIDLIVQINEHLLVGHFDMWAADRTVVFRHSQVFEQGQMVREPLVRQLSSAAAQAAEVLIPALNFLLWSNKTASQAVEAALFETVGEA